MSHQISIVHHFFPLNLQPLVKHLVEKNCLISEKSHKTTLKTSILLTYHLYETSKVICTSFFPLNLQLLEKYFVKKGCLISKKSHKTTLKTSILLTYHIFETSKVICTSFFSS